jgi:hypothetical protein
MRCQALPPLVKVLPLTLFLLLLPVVEVVAYRPYAPILSSTH